MVVRGTMVRLGPVLLTAMVALIAFTPLALLWGAKFSVLYSRDGNRGPLDIDRLDAFLPILFHGSSTNGLNRVVFFSTISLGLGTSLVSLSPQSPYPQLAHIHKLRK